MRRWKRRWLGLVLTAASTAAPAAGLEGATIIAAAKPEYVGARKCLSCHVDKISLQRDAHGAALIKAKGIPFDRACETCHGPGSRHAAAQGDTEDPGFLTIVNPAKAGSSRLCLQCHEGGRRMHWKGSAHDSQRLSCTSCHSVHKGEAHGGKGPLLAKQSPLETCFSCHADKKAQLRKSSHMPVIEGKMGCSACHNPHGGAGERLLAKSSVAETCYQCHQDKRGPFLFDHAPARESCSTCHEPHGSHHESMLVTRAPLLCQRCHVAGGHTALPYGAADAVQQKPYLFSKGCANCHPQVHGSNHPSGKWLMR